MTEAWHRREALELRYDGPIPGGYDGPIPAGDRPAAPAEALRRRMRLHRRLAMDYARQAAAAGGGAALALRRLAAERRSHSRLARLLGAALRRDGIPPLFDRPAPPHV